MSPTSLAKGKAQVKDCQLALNLEEEVVHIVFREMISGTIIILTKLLSYQLLLLSYHTCVMYFCTCLYGNYQTV